MVVLARVGVAGAPRGAVESPTHARLLITLTRLLATLIVEVRGRAPGRGQQQEHPSRSCPCCDAGGGEEVRKARGSVGR